MKVFNDVCEKRQNDIENSMKVIKDEFESVKLLVTDLTKLNVPDIKEEVTSLKTTFADIVSKNVIGSAGLGSVGGVNQFAEIDRKVQTELTEALEREKRRNNLIIAGLTDTDDSSVLKREIAETLEAAGVNASVNFEIVGRVGKPIRDKNRMCRISIEDSQHRLNVLRSSKNLKNVVGKERVFIMPDLTKKQQELSKKLRDKLKEV